MPEMTPENFDTFLKQGGQAWIDEESAKRKAERRRAIRQGEIPFQRLIEIQEERLRRLELFAEHGLDFLTEKALEQVEKGAEDLRLSFEETIKETEESDA